MFKAWLNKQPPEKIEELAKECRKIYNCGAYSEEYSPGMNELVHFAMNKHSQITLETAQREAFLAVAFRAAGIA